MYFSLSFASKGGGDTEGRALVEELVADKSARCPPVDDFSTFQYPDTYLGAPKHKNAYEIK
jgi:hypothetical protein